MKQEYSKPVVSHEPWTAKSKSQLMRKKTMAGPRKSVSYSMTEEDARGILAEMEYGILGYQRLLAGDGEPVGLDLDCTAEDLKALVWWMEHMKGEMP